MSWAALGLEGSELGKLLQEAVSEISKLDAFVNLSVYTPSFIRNEEEVLL